MGTVISEVAVAAPAPANLYADRLGAPPAEASRVLAEGVPSRARGGVTHGLRLILTSLGGLGEVLAVAYAFRVAILAIGKPIALFLRTVMWMVGVVVTWNGRWPAW
jgi:hypothetical protein